jgi:hypothetical protein
MTDSIAGIAKEIEASWTKMEAFCFSSFGGVFRVRYKPTSVNGSAVVSRSGYP